MKAQIPGTDEAVNVPYTYEDGGRVRRGICPNCCATPYQSKSGSWRGGAIFDRIAGDEWECRNCGHTEPARKQRRGSDMTPSQRKAIIRVLRYFKKDVAYTGCTSVRIERKVLDWGAVSLTVTTRRSDCDPRSPRQVLCQQYAHMLIGRRGGIKKCSARSGVDDNTEHVAKMLGAA